MFMIAPSSPRSLQGGSDDFYITDVCKALEGHTNLFKGTEPSLLSAFSLGLTVVCPPSLHSPW